MHLSPPLSHFPGDLTFDSLVLVLVNKADNAHTQATFGLCQVLEGTHTEKEYLGLNLDGCGPCFGSSQFSADQMISSKQLVSPGDKLGTCQA